MSIISIRDLQGDDYLSAYADQDIVTSGVVTGVLRRGFFIQTPNKEWDGIGSDAVFVFSTESTVSVGCEVEIHGRCVNYIKHDTAKPVTQIRLDRARVISTQSEPIDPIEFTQEFLPTNNDELARLLNSLEGMLITINAGQTFIAPSNPFGDYVLALDAHGTDTSVVRSRDGGALVSGENPLRWFPGFRVTNYDHAQRVNVGATLDSSIIGPLNYRVDAYQLSVNAPFEIKEKVIEGSTSRLQATDGSLTVMTLNCFNLDPHVESADLVMNPNQDIDDDWGEGRFHSLAKAIVLQANTPDIVALQEIQDNDGAQITDIVDASKTYELLIKAIKQFCDIQYHWVDVPPVVGADGGQPGGNIRNGYLYNPSRVTLDTESVRVFGESDESFDGSRKPLIAEFIEKKSAKRLAVINVHLASKRHQNSIFAIDEPGVDKKESVRIAQTRCIRREAETVLSSGTEFYITGDFNDLEHSKSLLECVGDKAVNLVLSLPPEQRYDYNHRGKLQVLMHGIVPKAMAEERAEYDIIHGNELIGVEPGQDSDKASDHAYVLARLQLV